MLSKDTAGLFTHTADGCSFLHGLETLFGVQLVDELVSEADGAICCLIELVDLARKNNNDCENTRQGHYDVLTTCN